MTENLLFDFAKSIFSSEPCHLSPREVKTQLSEFISRALDRPLTDEETEVISDLFQQRLQHLREESEISDLLSNALSRPLSDDEIVRLKHLYKKHIS